MDIEKEVANRVKDADLRAAIEQLKRRAEAFEIQVSRLWHEIDLLSQIVNSK